MERECEEGGDIEKKLRRSFYMGNYSTRAGPSTPPPTWRLGLSPPRLGAFSGKEFLVDSEVSVRKLCAELWETEHFRPPVGLPRCRRRDSDVESPSDHQPPSRGSLRRRQIVSTDNDQRLVHRHGDLLQRITPSSSSNHSLEAVKRKPAFSQTGSSLVKSASYGLGSSTKLLKVLNRIWSLEEQNTANTSLVKALKMELDECRAEIKEVQHREKQSHRRVCKEEEEMKDVFRSMKKELEEEREVRKKAESMHRKLTRELCEAKHCLTKALKDLENERKERVVVEDLCGEFAKTVKDYEDKERRRSHSSKDDSVYMHQRVCLKELEEGLKRRSRRDNKLQLKRTDQVLNLSMSSEGDKIHPEIGTPRKVDDDHESLEKYRKTFSKNVMVREESRSLKDKLMEARVESRRLRSLKSTPSHPVQAI
ncbi:hypothetical protein Bca4012_034875 [Brassica carinata]|uniref:Uncharacterized protein n=1 Tax=Brassica carinata TaxID=52824 RepID=A0A8X7USG9_BRACI|nr:hypothetical protein Bca52824_050169 [Brassica carinata]